MNIFDVIQKNLSLLDLKIMTVVQQNQSNRVTDDIRIQKIETDVSRMNQNLENTRKLTFQVQSDYQHIQQTSTKLKSDLSTRFEKFERFI